MSKVAINGLGRIGRAALNVLLDGDDPELVPVNDVADLDNLVYLLKYDTVYGRYPGQVPKASADMADIVDLMLATGCRIGEILALRWSDLELDRD